MTLRADPSSVLTPPPIGQPAQTRAEVAHPRSAKPLRAEDVLDGHKLRVQLTTAALDNIGNEQAATRTAVDHLHRALFRGRMIAQEMLESGHDGVTVARFLSDVQDQVLMALFDFAVTHVFRSRNRTEGERLSLFAVGGYGRGTLAPSSDLDLLFVRSYKSTPWAESVIEYMLYRLWDLGVKVGHAVRTPEECIRLAREDHTIRTALLDARFLLGDEDLGKTFLKSFRDEAARYKLRDYVAAKLSERDARHVRLGGSRYSVEPNVKESKGGLRDLDSLGWIANAVSGVRGLEDLATQGLFSVREAAIFRRASRFLWSVRCHLHYLTGRAEERLSFDLQPEIARRMGYVGRADNIGVERFMKRYFIAAKEVGTLTRIFSAKMEAESHKLPERIGWLVPRDTRNLANKGLRMRGGRLDLMPDALDKDPVTMLRLFEEAGLRGLDLHPEAMEMVTRRVRGASRALRDSKEANRIFLDILTGRQQPYETLTRLNETGLLGGLIPEFGRIVGQTQFNMYHHYTVDEHSLLLIDTLHRIETGALTAELPLSSEVIPKIIGRRALYLAALLHDTGKGQGDQQIEGAQSARAACLRLGLEAAEAELVAWLVGNHLEMSDTAQRRDISDPRTISAFTQRVGSLERLRLLLLLTVADIRAVGPGVWNGWKGQLLRELYYATEAALRGGTGDERHTLQALQSRAEAARQALRQSQPETAWALLAFNDAYWLSFDADTQAWHAAIAAGTAPQSARAATRILQLSSASELVVAAPDRPGLFADLAAMIASEGGDILTAGGYTREDGMALDVFALLDGTGKAFGHDDPSRLARLESQALRAVAGELFEAQASRPDRRQAAFLVEPSILFDTEASADCTLIEVSGRNRPGLLRDLARTLTNAGLDLRSAHVGTYGETACDVFYVQLRDGSKALSARLTDDIAQALMAVLTQAEPDAPKTPARRLAQARASSNR